MVYYSLSIILVPIGAVRLTAPIHAVWDSVLAQPTFLLTLEGMETLFVALRIDMLISSTTSALRLKITALIPLWRFSFSIKKLVE